MGLFYNPAGVHGIRGLTFLNADRSLPDEGSDTLRYRSVAAVYGPPTVEVGLQCERCDLPAEIIAVQARFCSSTFPGSVRLREFNRMIAVKLAMQIVPKPGGGIRFKTYDVYLAADNHP
jgi:hypothetical protein